MIEPWFTQAQAGLVGAILGSVIGLLGGVHGTVVGLLAPRGRGRVGVLAFYWLLVAAGVALLSTGGVAAAVGQPWYVWWGFVLCGLITTAVVGGLTPVLYLRYRQAEEWRMTQQDAV